MVGRVSWSGGFPIRQERRVSGAAQRRDRGFEVREFEKLGLRRLRFEVIEERRV